MIQIKIVKYIILFFSISFLMACTSSHVVYPEHLDVLHKNLLAYYLATPIDDSKVSTLMDEMNDEGAWSTIDYTNRVRGGWSVKDHLSNVQMLALAYRTKGNQYFHKKNLSKQIHLSLNYWLQNDFLSPNWWDQHIGVPELLGPILFLMEDELTDQQLKQALVLMRRADIKMTGQNKVWLSGIVLFRSLLLRDTDSIAMASRSIQEELQVGRGEGIQPDWSYHQHGPQLQFGNYGLSYLEDMLRWQQILDNTPFAFSRDKADIMRHYALEGMQWVDWQGRFDVSACGRQIFPNETRLKSQRFRRVLTTLAKIDEANSAQYQLALGNTPLSGNRHFWHSDFQVQRSSDYYFSVKMCSNRVLGAETVNRENIQGYHMGDGVALLYRSGREYESVLPFWDWRKLPGTTLIQEKDTLPYLTAWGYHIPSDFVGGVSDSTHGIAVLDYKRDGLLAHKAWFMLDDKIVCLGSGIQAQTSCPVVTTVNQLLLKDGIVIHTEGKSKHFRKRNGTHAVDWVLHDSVGYAFPDGCDVTFQSRIQEGSWHNVAKKFRPVILTDNVFRLWIDHGTNPSRAGYAYVIIPNADEETMNCYQNNTPFKITNTESFQEVSTTDGHHSGTVFYTAGKSTLCGGVEVDAACLLLLSQNENTLKISLADPTQKLQTINIKIGKHPRMKIDLPQNADAGKTVSFSLKI